LHEAAEAIRQFGPDRIGVAGLMAKAGLTVGGFYAHFKSKDDLIAQAIPHMFEDRAEVLQDCKSGVGPAQALRSFVDVYLSTQHRDRRERGCPLPALSGDLPRMPAAARKRFEAGVRRMTDSIADLLKQIGQPAPDELAASIVSEMVGAIVLARAVPSAELSARILEGARDQIKRRAGL
jgi:TetR/AcrR family transcriptional repressor of nem operon